MPLRKSIIIIVVLKLIILMALMQPTTAHSGTLDIPLDEEFIVQSLAWSPDGTKIAVGGQPIFCNLDDSSAFSVLILDAGTGSIVQRLKGETCSVSSLSWSPDSLYLTAALRGIAYNVPVWNVTTGALISIQKIASMGILQVAWRPDGSVIVYADMTNEVGYIDPLTGETVTSEVNIFGTSVDWSPDGQKLVKGHILEDIGAVSITDIFEGTYINLDISPIAIFDVDWSPVDGKVAAATENGVLILDTEALQILQSFPTLHSVHEVDWNFDGIWLAAATEDGVWIWNVDTGQEIRTIQDVGRVFTVNWSPDGTHLAYGGSDGIVHIIARPGSETLPGSHTDECKGTIRKT